MNAPDDPNQLLCYCHGVPWGVVTEVVRENGCKTVAQVTQLCKAGGGCKSCHAEIREVIDARRSSRTARGGGFWSRLFGKGRPT